MTEINRGYVLHFDFNVQFSDFDAVMNIVLYCIL